MLAGPLPPAIGGMSTFIADLAGSRLREAAALELFNTGKSTPEDRSLWQGVRVRTALLARWWQLVGSSPRPIAHVHTCSGFVYFVDATMAAMAKARGCRTILHIHGARFDEFLSGLPKPLRWLACALARRADRVVVLSPEWQGRLAGLLPGAKLAIVHNGVPAALGATELRPPDGIVRLIFLGNLGRRKGVPELVEAVAGLPEHVHLELAGGEEDVGIVEELSAAIHARGLAHRIHLLGPVRGEAKQACWRRADIFVLPSHAEGVPISMLEAMSIGLPVVVTAVGGIPTVIEDGRNGRLVAPGDVTGLRAALAELAADAALRQTFGEAARLRWRENFSIDHTVGELLALYASISDRPPAAPGGQGRTGVEGQSRAGDRG